MNDDNQVLIEEITEIIKIDWKESIRGLLSCWSDDVFRGALYYIECYCWTNNIHPARMEEQRE